MEGFSARLKECREKNKAQNSMWTQQYVANKINVARSTYTAYEKGTKMPPGDTINKLAILFDVSNNYLMGRTEDDEFERWLSNPADERFFEEYHQAPEERRAALREVWEILKKQGKD